VVSYEVQILCPSYELSIAFRSISYAPSAFYAPKERLVFDVLLVCGFVLLCAWFVLERLRHRI
jgi:hypothetical protein